MHIIKCFRPYKIPQNCQQNNPIRNFIENEIGFIPFTEPHPKSFINMSLGDPCAYKDFKPNSEDLALLSQSVGKYNDYVDFSGLKESRNYLKDYYSKRSNFELDLSDIFITHGTTLAIHTLAENGDNIIMPKPGFPSGKSMAQSHKITVREYSLLPNKNWEVDLNDLETLIDEKTKAILVNNPNNPTGAVYSKEHIAEVLKIAEKYTLPIIVDEVYEDMVYPGVKFVSFAEVSTTVPILLCSGLSKKYFAPGWRTGWLVLHGPKGVFDQIKIGLNNLCSILMNSNTICMQNIKKILEKDLSFLKGRMEKIQQRMKIFQEYLKGLDFYEVLEAYGTIYAVILIKLEKFQGIIDSKDFCLKLFKSQNVLCLPGECFGSKGFIRIVTCSDEEMIKEFCKRMKDFYLLNKKE